MGRGTLGASDYVDATLELVDTIGIGEISMRRVADQLGLSPMATYRHFPGKEALLVAALDEFIARADIIPRQALAWDDWIRVVARAMHRALAAHPGWLPLLGSLGLGSNAATVTRAFVDRLVQEGFTPDQALRAWFAVIQVVIGAVCLGGPIRPPPADAPATTDDGPRGSGPVALALGEVLAGLGTAEQLDLGLPFVIEALQMHLPGTAADATGAGIRSPRKLARRGTRQP